MCCSYVTISVVSPLDAQAVLEPPFGLHWGDSPEKLITWASRQSLNVTISTIGAKPALRILKIQPAIGFLPDTQAGSVEGRFNKGKLFELTVHYFDPKATAEELETRFEIMRKQTALDHGPLLTNQQQRVVVNQFVTRTRSFHQEPLRGIFLILTFTEEIDLLRNLNGARFSIVYRNTNCE